MLIVNAGCATIHCMLGAMAVADGGDLGGALQILFVILVGVLGVATAAVATATWALARACRRSGSVGVRLASAAWGLVLVAGVMYARHRLGDMTLDPSKGDFWWSAWIVVVGGAAALVAWLAAAAGRAHGARA